METIQVRELNQNTSAVVARVSEGEIIEVTVHGRPAIRLVPLTPSPLDDLIRNGRIIPAMDHSPFPMPRGEIDTVVDSTTIISELREESL